ncbi:MAG: calcium-binding protein [Microcoleaceae cyanobacterium]
MAFIDGTPQNDFLQGTGGNDVMFGRQGFDAIDGFAGNDFIYGNQQGDQLFGKDGADNLFGGQDNDALEGGNGRDFLSGDNGNDFMNGGAERDTLQGGSGADFFFADTSLDFAVDFNPNEGDSTNGTFTPNFASASSSEASFSVHFELDGDDLILSNSSGGGLILVGLAPEMNDPLGFFNYLSSPKPEPSAASDSLTNPQPVSAAQWEYLEPLLPQFRETAADWAEQIEAETDPLVREGLQGVLSEMEERIAYTESLRPLPVEETDSLLVEEVPIIQEAYFFAEGSVIPPELQNETAGTEVFFLPESSFTQPEPDTSF